MIQDQDPSLAMAKPDDAMPVERPEHLQTDPLDTENVSDSDDEQEAYNPPSINVHVTMDLPARRELTEKEAKRYKSADDAGVPFEFAAALHVDQNVFNAISENFPKIKPEEVYLAKMYEGLAHFQRNNALGNSLDRVNGDWRQFVDNGTERLRAGSPKLSEGGPKATGEAAVMRAKALMGLGQVYSIPLWHSGFWINIKTPDESALLELDQYIATNKVELGKVTNGLLFSNDSVLLNKALVDFVIRLVYDSSLTDNSPENLKKHILLTDLPSLIWGLAVAVWPNGFKYIAPCVRKPEACTHVVEEILNIARLHWVDNSMLSEDQRRHMARRGRDKYTLESIEKYQAAHRYHTDDLTVIAINDRTKFRLRVPSLADYETAGNLWIDGIRSMIEGGLAADLSDRERAQYMFDQGSVTALQQYAHWVKEIAIQNGDSDEIFDDETVMARILAAMTKDDDARTEALDAFKKFIDESTIALVGIPAYKCPACQTPQNDEEAKHPYLIPLEVNRIFFTLLTRRLSRMLNLL